MGFETPQFNTGEVLPEKESAKKKGGLKNKLQKLAAFGAIGVAALTGEGCAPDKNGGSEKQTSDPPIKSSKWVSPDLDEAERQSVESIMESTLKHPKEFIERNSLGRGEEMFEKLGYEKILELYYAGIKEGKHPDTFDVMTRARAVEISRKKGKRAMMGNTSVSAVAGVPVRIEVDGQVIPVGPSDYSAEELRNVRALEDARGQMRGEAPERHLQDSSAVGNSSDKSEKRKSKSDF